MSFASWLKSLTAHAKRVPVRRRGYSPRLETLEDRMAYAKWWLRLELEDYSEISSSLTFF